MASARGRYPLTEEPIMRRKTRIQGWAAVCAVVAFAMLTNVTALGDAADTMPSMRSLV